METLPEIRGGDSTRALTDFFADDCTVCIPARGGIINDLVSIFQDFEKISGLQLNCKKTQILINNPERCGDDFIDACRTHGFEIIEEAGILGYKVKDFHANKNQNWEGHIARVQAKAREWKNFPVSILGRVNVTKTILLSAAVFNATIFRPTEKNLDTLQKIMNTYLLGGIKMQKKLVYNQPADGGLGFFELASFFVSLQCKLLIESWDLADFWTDKIRSITLDGNIVFCHPINAN